MGNCHCLPNKNLLYSLFSRSHTVRLLLFLCRIFLLESPRVLLAFSGSGLLESPSLMRTNIYLFRTGGELGVFLVTSNPSFDNLDLSHVCLIFGEVAAELEKVNVFSKIHLYRPIAYHGPMDYHCEDWKWHKDNTTLVLWDFFFVFLLLPFFYR